LHYSGTIVVIVKHVILLYNSLPVNLTKGSEVGVLCCWRKS